MIKTLSTFRTLSLCLLCCLFGLFQTAEAQQAQIDPYYPNCLYAETEDNFQACHTFCQANPNHWGCNAACLVDPGLCAPAYPDCATNPEAEGCPIFCLNNAGHDSCDYICAVAPQYCPDTADSVCSNLGETACADSDVCAPVRGAGGCECEADQFLACGASFDTIACYDIFTEDECLAARGCAARRSDDADAAFLFCVPDETQAATDCSTIADEAGCNAQAGCFAETDTAGAFTVCVPANNEECNTYPTELCTEDNGCQEFRGLKCSCATEQQYYGCAPSDDAAGIDTCDLNPTQDGCNNFEVSHCALFPEHWKCRPECLENPAGCTDMPQTCIENPDNCETQVNAMCTHAEPENIDACNDFCIQNPNHYACSWICQYKYDPDYCGDIDGIVNPDIQCQDNPTQSGCPEYCGANPDDPNCAYICIATDLCNTDAGSNSTSVVTATEFTCEESPYTHGCPNFCQENPNDDACPETCLINPESDDCAPVCVANGDEGACATPYCTLHPEDAGCGGDQTKTYCQANPDADGCTPSCSSDNPDPSCISFCERFPGDSACPEPIDNIPGLVSADDPIVTVADFCGLPGSGSDGDTTNQNLQPCADDPTQSYCEVHPTDTDPAPDACGEFADGSVFNKCANGTGAECMGNLFLQHAGHGLAQRDPSTDVNTPDKFQANEGRVDLIFFMDEAQAGSGNEDTSGINFTDANQSWISHLAVERTTPDGTVTSEMFVNPGISFQAHPTYRWNMNTHKFKGDRVSIFEKVGTYKYVLGLCDKAGNCLYSQKHYAEVVPAEITEFDFPGEFGSSTLTSECQNFDGSDDAGDLKFRVADGKEACSIAIHLQDRFGNPFMGDQDALGNLAVEVSGQTFNGYHMSLRGREAFKDALRIQSTPGDSSTNARMYTGTTDTNGNVTVGVSSFLPSSDTDVRDVCGDQKFYMLFNPKNTTSFDANDKVQLDVSVPVYTKEGELTDFVQRQVISAPNVGLFYTPYVTNVVSAEEVPPPADVIRPDVGIHFPVHVESQTSVAGTDLPQNLLVEVTGLGSIGFEDRNYKDVITYNHDALSTTNPGTIPGAGADNTVLSGHSTKITFDAGEVSSLNFGFTSRIRYNISAEISDTANGVSVEYPGANLGNKFCDTEIQTEDMVGGNDSVARVTFRGADIEGGFMKITDRIVMKNLDADEISGTDGDIATVAFSLNALNVDRANIRTGVRNRATNLTNGLDPHNSSDLTTVTINAAGKPEVDGVEVAGDVTYIQGQPDAPGLVVLEGGLLKGKHTLILEDVNLLVKGDLTYDNDASDSWGFILLTTDPANLTPALTDVSTNAAGVEVGYLDPNQDFFSNIFVHKDVKQIVGTFFADGAITSTESLGAANDIPSVADPLDRTKDGPLETQLILTGALFTQNTFGGSMLSDEAGGPLDPWGRKYRVDPGVLDDRGANEARIFDLHYVRQYAYSTQDPNDQHAPLDIHDDLCTKIAGDANAEADGCYANHHSFVIRLDRKVQTQTPPGFDAEYGYTIFD